MRFYKLVQILCALPFLAGGAAACPAQYDVQPGDTLVSIAQTTLGDPAKWSRIFYNNPGLRAGGTYRLQAGISLSIPCDQNGQIGADPTPLRTNAADMVLVTGSNFAPFSDRDWPGQGMLTELVNAALAVSPDAVPYNIAWEDDWGRQADALAGQDFDMGYPWFRPDCQTTPDAKHCQLFHFSEPVVDLAVLLFTRADATFDFVDEADLQGKTLCRPEGYYAHDLDRVTREQVSPDMAKLERAKDLQSCFAKLLDGSVDAVAVNEFLAMPEIARMGLKDKVVALPRPVAVEGLHVIVSKHHWRGTTLLYRFNAGLAELKKSDRYAEIINRHVAHFWETVRAN